MKLRRFVSLEAVHEICDILLERGLATNSEEVKEYIENADVVELEGLYQLAMERIRRKRRLLGRRSYDYDYAYSYIG